MATVIVPLCSSISIRKARVDTDIVLTIGDTRSLRGQAAAGSLNVNSWPDGGESG